MGLLDQVSQGGLLAGMSQQDKAIMLLQMGAATLANNTGNYGRAGPAIGAGLGAGANYMAQGPERAYKAMQMKQFEEKMKQEAREREQAEAANNDWKGLIGDNSHLSDDPNFGPGGLLAGTPMPQSQFGAQGPAQSFALKMAGNDPSLRGPLIKSMLETPDIDPNKPFIRLQDGSIAANKDYQDYEIRKAQMGRAPTESPSNVREWSFYNSLSPDDKVQYLNMKRQNYQITDIGGVPSVASRIPGTATTPLSSLGQEVEGKSAIAGGEAGARNAAEYQAKRDFNMRDIGKVIKQAEDLLSGKGGAKPTGSLLGTAADYAGSVVGYSPAGAAEAQQLKAVAGALTSKMPRMEGPQSNLDAQLYREMAAVVGDSTIPTKRRLAALKKVEEIWGKYENKPVAQPPTDGGIKFLGFEE